MRNAEAHSRDGDLDGHRDLSVGHGSGENRAALRPDGGRVLESGLDSLRGELPGQASGFSISKRVRNRADETIDQICSSPEFIAAAKSAALTYERTATTPRQIEGARGDINVAMRREHGSMPRLHGRGRGQL